MTAEPPIAQCTMLVRRSTGAPERCNNPAAYVLRWLVDSWPICGECARGAEQAIAAGAIEDAVGGPLGPRSVVLQSIEQE